MAWRCRFLAARRSQHGSVMHATHWLISTQVVMDVVPDVEMVRSGLDYSMHGMLAHNSADDDDATPKQSKARGPEKTEEMDGSGAKVGIRLDP